MHPLHLKVKWRFVIAPYFGSIIALQWCTCYTLSFKVVFLVPGLLYFCSYFSVSEWVKASFAEVSPEPIEEGEPSELAELRNEMIKNKKRIKSMMAMLEAQNKLLRNLAETIDPTAVLPEVPDDEFGADDVDGGPRAPLHQTEHGGKEPPEDKGVDVVT